MGRLCTATPGAQGEGTPLTITRGTEMCSTLTGVEVKHAKEEVVSRHKNPTNERHKAPLSWPGLWVISITPALLCSSCSSSECFCFLFSFLLTWPPWPWWGLWGPLGLATSHQHEELLSAMQVSPEAGETLRNSVILK